MIKAVRTKTAALVAACGLLGVVGTGAALAYLTDGETTTNTFTVGDVSIEALETGWPGNDSNVTKDLVPNKELPKNPKVVNRGINDAIVFMTVDSPMENITVISDNGTVVTPKSVNELFWFKDADDAASTHANHFDTDSATGKWMELTAKEMWVRINNNTKAETQVSADNISTIYGQLQPYETLVKRYVFAYKTPIQGSSTHDGSPQTSDNLETSPLFDKIQLKNIIEGEIDEEATQKVVVRTYAIQSTEILESSADLTDSLDAATLGKIYDIYIRQNSTGNNASGLQVTGLRDVDSITGTSNGSSGTTDSHTNRWDTNDNVTSSGTNLNPLP
jgi:predicted ribosomally synthesized peptide with SipW-like signal peptide